MLLFIKCNYTLCIYGIAVQWEYPSCAAQYLRFCYLEMSFKHSVMCLVSFLKSFLSPVMNICMRKQSSEGYNSCDLAYTCHVPVVVEKFPLLEPGLPSLYAWKRLFHLGVGIFISLISNKDFCYSWWKGGLIRRRDVTNNTHEAYSLWKALLWQQWSSTSPAWTCAAP